MNQHASSTISGNTFSGGVNITSRVTNSTKATDGEKGFSFAEVLVVTKKDDVESSPDSAAVAVARRKLSDGTISQDEFDTVAEADHATGAASHDVSMDARAPFQSPRKKFVRRNNLSVNTKLSPDADAWRRAGEAMRTPVTQLEGLHGADAEPSSFVGEVTRALVGRVLAKKDTRIQVLEEALQIASDKMATLTREKMMFNVHRRAWKASEQALNEAILMENYIVGALKKKYNVPAEVFDEIMQQAESQEFNEYHRVAQMQ